jgi:hypothetical protein
MGASEFQSRFNLLPIVFELFRRDFNLASTVKYDALRMLLCIHFSEGVADTKQTNFLSASHRKV